MKNNFISIILLVIILFTSIISCKKGNIDISQCKELKGREKALCMCNTTTNQDSLIFWLNELAITYKSSNLDTTLLLIDSVKSLCKNTNYPIGLAEALNIEGEILTKQLNPLAEQKFKEAINIAQSNSSSLEEANYLSNLGVYYTYTQKTDSAIYYHDKAREIRLRIDHKKGIMLSDINLGYLYFAQGYFEVAQKYWLTAYDTATVLNTPDRSFQLGQISLNLGGLYMEMGDFEKGKVFTEKAISFLKNTKDERILANLAMNRAILYRYESELDTAKVFFEKAIQNAQTISDYNVWLKSILNLAETYIQEKKITKAVEKANEGIKMTKALGATDAQSLFEYLLGEIATERKDYIEAIKRFSNSIDLGQSNDILKYIDGANLALADIFEKKGQYQASLDYMRKYNIAKNKIINEEKVKKSAELEVLYELNDKNRTIKEQQISLQLSKKQKENARLYSIILVILALLLTVIAFSFFRKAKKRKKEVQEIKHRNRNQLQNLQDVMTTQALLHPKDSEAVKNIQNNIQSLNVLYNLLETSPDGNKINAKKYFSDLVKHLVITFGWNAKNIQINENIAANLIFEGNQTAIPIAQILTELFTNIFKHAFPKDKILEPKIILSLKNIKNEMILELRDNGVGMEHSSASSGTSEGMEITNFFVKNSLKGTINTVSNDNGTKHIIKFPAHV